MNKFVAAIVVGMIICLLGSCKTTVKNYQDAYEVAREKRERDEARHRQLQEEMGIVRGQLENVDEPSIGRIELTDPADSCKMSVKAANVAFHRDDKVVGVALAVARFKMAANAEGLTADLKAEGFSQARMARSGEEYYVLIGEGTYPADLAAEAFRFKKNFPDFPYVGVSEMLLIYPR